MSKRNRVYEMFNHKSSLTQTIIYRGLHLKDERYGQLN